MLKQKTLRGSFSLNGKGLHTGVNLTVTFNPAPDNHGYKIQRIDLEGQPIIDAVAENVGDTTRGTVLMKNGIKVSTVEHALAALYAAGIDNCLIQVSGPEFPILDGSAKAYVENIQRVGIEEQNAVKDYYIIKSKIEFRDEETGSSIIVLPDENFSVNALISYQSKILSNQFATLEDMAKFPTEVASARTFVFVREIEPLLGAGLIKGGDLDNAIVIYEKEMSQENYDKLADVMGVPHMDATKLGYINHIPLVWDNEPARHKLLDIIGDLALIGKPIKGRIIATRPGHTINNKFARQIRKEIKLHEIQAHPITAMNPHHGRKPHSRAAPAPLSVPVGGQSRCHRREPHCRCEKCNSQRTFLPGTLPARTRHAGRIAGRGHGADRRFTCSELRREPERYSTTFMKIDGVKFRQKVVPGDTLIFRVELLDSYPPGYLYYERLCICRRKGSV